MSEQLWYTWSMSGLGRSNGLRVRAASAQLTEVESLRVRSLLPLLGYALPETTDAFLPPDQAPLSLTFLKTGTPPEKLLLQKMYAGLDGVRRPGNFFSHLLTELPEVPSPTPSGQLPFSAREAIQLWRSSLWRESEAGWPANKYDLPAIPPNDLLSGVYTGSLSEKSVQQLSTLFPLVLGAFLTLGLSPEPRRLYLVGEPDTVAALIWGITHALPRTLDLMQRLTFSTFEANVELDARPLIVGTCWQPGFIKKGYEHAPMDLPDAYYQANNRYGIAIDCAKPEHHTPYEPTTLVARYVRFALHCFEIETSNGMAALTFLQDAAEKREISELPAFLQHYVQFHEMLKEEDVTGLLTSLYEKAATLLNPAQEAPAKKRLEGLPSVSTLQTEANMFQRENVQQSLLTLMIDKPDWWQRQGRRLLVPLFELSRQTTKTQMQEAQALLKEALLPLITIFIEQLVQAVNNDHKAAIDFWQSVLLQLTPPEIEPEPWLSLLLILRRTISNPGFVYWWRSQGQQTTAHIRRLVEQNRLDGHKELLPFAQEVARQLVMCIREEISSNQHQYDASIDFFLQILAIAVPAQDTQIWPELLHRLSKKTFAERCRWDLRATLLKSWKDVIVLSSEEVEPLLTPWLAIPWEAFDTLISLNLPESWLKIAVSNLLTIYHTLPADRVLSTVERYQPLFEEVVYKQLRSPQAQNNSLAFFAFLAANHYTRTLALLDLLLAACSYQKEITEKLFQALQPSSQEVSLLLEQHCQTLLTSYELPPAMLKLIERYIKNLDLEKVPTDETRNLFERLHNRDQNPDLRLPSTIQQPVESWYNIAAFLALPKANSHDLRTLLQRLRQELSRNPENRKLLISQLIPQVVTMILTEADLARTLDLLAPDDTLPLLKELAKVASEKYVQEDRPSRIAPYLSMVLMESRHLPQEEREIFVNDCFLLLFKEVPPEQRNQYRPYWLWPKELINDWNQAVRLLNSPTNAFNEHRQAIPLPTILPVALPQKPASQTGKIPSVAVPAAKQQSNPTPLPQPQPSEPQQFVATIDNTIKIPLELYERTLEVYKIYIQFLIEQYQRNIIELERSSSSNKKDLIRTTQREIKDMNHILNDVIKLRQLTLQELIDDFFIQEEIKQLGASRENIEWVQWFSKKTEQDTDIAYAHLQKAISKGHHPFPLKFTDPNDVLNIKKALKVFIRRQIFDKEFPDYRPGVMDHIKERRQRVQVDYRLAKYPEPRRKGW